MKNTFKCFPIFLLICGVFGVDADEVKTVTVMEGDSVTLNTDVTETQRISLIQWSFGVKGSAIALINEKDISYLSHIDIFTGKLQLDQTGSLTIKNMRITHSGLYKVEIDLKPGPSYMMKFNVAVYESPSVVDADEAEMKSVSVTEGYSAILQTDVTETLGDELIVWRFGDKGKLIAKHDIQAKSSPLYEDTERFRDRLKLDEKTGSLTITNTRTTDTGLYTVKISSNKHTLYRRFTVTVSEPGLSSGAVAGIVIGLLLLVSAAVGVIYYRRKISELESQKFKKVSVMEGDDVTLNTDVTEIQKDDLIEWRSGDGGPLIAAIRGGIIEIYDTGLDERFTDRLKLDKKTGSLTIMDSRTTDSGLYQLMIRQDSKVKYKMFNVSVCENTLSVFEGDPVTLKTDAELQSDDVIEWSFGYKENLIAAIRGGNNSKFDEETVGMFRGRLKLNKTTGSLTITDTEMKHAGVYQLLIKSNSGDSYKTFRVTVRARNISVTDGKNMILNPETEIQKDDQIQWRFGDKEILIAEIRGGTVETHDVADGRFRGRLKLDEKIGSLIIRDLTADHSGVYKLQIINSRGTTHKRFVVAVNPRMILVEEEKPVTLETNTEIQKDDQIQWRFGDKEFLIAEVRGGTGETHDDVDDGRFRRRLKLDEKSGSLTITDLTADHPGDYKLQIINSRGTTNTRFAVAVYPMIISVEEGKPVTLETNTEIQKDDQIQWWFEDILIAELRGGTRKTHDADGRFRGRLTLDEKSGSLTIARIRKELSYGVFKLQIINSRGTTNKRFRINKVYSGYTSKTVLEGKDVTLSSDTHIVKDERVKWLFNDEILAIREDGDINKTSYCDERFKDRLEFNLQTGSLTIKNTRTSDSGDYHLKVPKLGIERKFRVTVNESAVNDSATVQMPPVDEEDPDVSKSSSLKSATEGESVTLETNTEIHKDDQIQWMFGDILIAEVRGGTGETHDADGRFRGRLKLDEKTGSLTIARIRKEHSYGVFKLQIINSRGTTNKRFRINVYSAYTSETVLEGENVTLSSDTDIVKDEVKWLFNDEILATGKNGYITKTLYCDWRFKDRLELDHETGSLTIKNIRTSDSGDYHLKLSILGTERRFRVTVNDPAGNRVNDSATVQMPPVNEEDPDVGNEQEGMSLLETIGVSRRGARGGTGRGVSRRLWNMIAPPQHHARFTVNLTMSNAIGSESITA